MATRLVRRALPCGLDPTDRHAVRAWLMDEVRTEITRAGGPKPRLVRICDRAVETLDLDSVARDDPAFHPGATVALLARGARQVLVVARLANDELPERALVFHATGLTPAWWAATLPYERDPDTGLALPSGAWSTSVETEDPDDLPPLLRTWLTDPAGRPADVRPPDPLTEVSAAFGKLPDAAPLPTDARTLTHLAAALTVDDLLQGRVRGSVIVRLSGRDWESWVVGDDLPFELDEAIRAIACNGTRAEAVALIQLAVYDREDPPRPGLQCVAQHGDERLESWSLLAFPEGPGGRIELAGVDRSRRLPPSRGDGWLRAPDAPVHLIPLGAAEA